MANRALRLWANALRRQFTVAAGQTVTEFRRVKLAAEGTVQHCGANELGIGTAEYGGAAGEDIVVILDGHAVVPMKVGTGGVTFNKYVKPVADGVADITVADGTTPTYASGLALQSGVLGDVVGVMIGGPTPFPNA